jgi:hypothetical protein
MRAAGRPGPAKRSPADTSEPRWVAPFYDPDRPDFYHTSPDCPAGSAIPEERRRLDVAAMRARLPGW